MKQPTTLTIAQAKLSREKKVSDMEWYTEFYKWADRSMDNGMSWAQYKASDMIMGKVWDESRR